MKVLLTLILLGSLSFVLGEDAISKIKRPSMDVPERFVGKTLSEIGAIVQLQAEYGEEYPANTELLIDLLNNSRITPQSDLNVGIACGLPPHVKIKHADGTIVSSDRYEAVITLVDEEPFLCYLLPPERPLEPVQVDFLHLWFDEGFQNMDLKVQIGEHELHGAFPSSNHSGPNLQWRIPKPSDPLPCAISLNGPHEVLKWKFEVSASKGRYLWFSFSGGNMLFNQIQQPYWLYGDELLKKASILTPAP